MVRRLMLMSLRQSSNDDIKVAMMQGKAALLALRD
jgi:hypothetical protein